MTEPIRVFPFSGVLGRTTIELGRATLRFYPWVFSLDPDARPVLVAEFVNPRFDDAIVKTFETSEILEVTLYAGRLEYCSAYVDAPYILAADNVTAAWAAYDTQDLFERIRQLEEWQRELDRQHHGAVGINNAGLSLTTELLRRAELKANSSVEMAERQKAAIAVLKRLQAHFQAVPDQGEDRQRG